MICRPWVVGVSPICSLRGAAATFFHDGVMQPEKE